MSGILLGKTMGRTDDLALRFERESGRLADLEVRSRMTGRWMMAAIQTTFAVMPALVYWFAGWTISQGSDDDHDRHPRRVHDAPDAALLPDRQPARSADRGAELARAVRPDLRVPRRGSGHRRRARARSSAPRGDVRLDAVWFRYDDAAWTLQDVSFTVPPGRRPPSSVRRARGRRPARISWRGSTTRREGTVSIDGVDVRELTFESLAAAVGVVSQETYLFHATVRENLRFARPEASDEEIEEAARAAQIHELIASLPGGLRHGGRRARLPLLRRREAAHRDRAHDAAQPADPRPRRGDLVARHADRARSCRRRSSACRQGARRSRSRTGSRPCGTPTRSSCSTAAASWRSERYDELIARGWPLRGARGTRRRRRRADTELRPRADVSASAGYERRVPLRAVSGSGDR